MTSTIERPGVAAPAVRRGRGAFTALLLLACGALLGGGATFGVLFEKPGRNAVMKLERMVEGLIGADGTGGGGATAGRGVEAWQPSAGLAVQRHAAGFDSPVRLVFAPAELSRQPGGVFYWVAELGGTIKAVTRAGEVSVVAEGLLDFERAPLAELGLLGLDFDAQRACFYAALTYWDETAGVYRNKVERLDLSPDLRALAGRSVLLDMAPEDTVASYQIQFCRLDPAGKLWVGVGSGGRKHEAQDVDKFAGKILRLEKDGSGVADNPLFDPAAPRSPRSTLYAWGFRNPFDVAFDPRSGTAIVSDVGPGIDRLVRVEAGVDYVFGNDENEIRANALYTWGPGTNYAPVGVTFGRDTTLGEAAAFDLFVGLFGQVHVPGGNDGKRIVSFDIRPSGHLESMARDVVRYGGTRFASVVDVEWGEDGLYFTDLWGESLEPHRDGGVVYRLVHDPDAVAPAEEGADLAGAERGRFLFYRNGCNTCHVRGGQGGAEGPSLENARAALRARLLSDGYEDGLRALAARDEEFFVAQRPAYDALLQLSGDARLRRWLAEHLRDPRFDHPEAKMPSFDFLSAQDVEALADFLLD